MDANAAKWRAARACRAFRRPMLPEAAVAAARRRWKEYSLEAAPRDWARAQALLGHAQTVLGERAGDPEWLEAAIGSYVAAMNGLYPRGPRRWTGRECSATAARFSYLGRETAGAGAVVAGGRLLSRGIGKIFV